MGRVAAGLGALGAALYMALPLRRSPDPVDGGLLYGYLQLMADGGRPFHDFLDVYGLAHWPLPLLAYKLAGQHVLGVRVLLWLLKLGVLCIAHRLVQRLTDRPTAWLSSVCLTVLFGLPWSYLQTPYAFVPVQLLSLGVLWLLCFGTTRPALLGAGALTGLVLCMKLNSGAFLLAAGLCSVVYFRAPSAAPLPTPLPRSRPWTALRCAGLVALNTVLLVLVLAHYSAQYFVYLTLPVALCSTWALTTPDLAGPRQRLSDAARYTATSLGTALGYVLFSVGPSQLGRYFDEQRAILSHLDYHSPLPALGAHGLYVGFNEWLWPQLPWLVTALGLTLLVIAQRTRAQLDAKLGTVFALYACQLFVIYARSDETHLLQALPLTLVTLFVLLHTLGTRLQRPRAAFGFMLALTLGFSVSLASWPGLSRLLGPGDWHGPHLRGLWYTDAAFDHYLPSHGALDPRTWDATTDRAAQYIAAVSPLHARTLVLDPTEILSFASGTQPAGGRHHYLFYLVQAGFFSRADFDAVAPPELLRDLLRDPPDVIVNTFIPGALETAFPELRALLRQRYRLGQRFRHLNVWLRADLSPAVAEPH